MQVVQNPFSPQTGSFGSGTGTGWQGRESIRPHSLARYRRSPGENEVRPLDWKFRAAGESVAGLEFPDDPLEMLRIRIERRGENSYDIQLNAPGWQLQSGVDYVLSFRARADEERSIYTGISQAVEPWNNLGLYHEMQLSPDWKSVEVRFQCVASSNEARIHFDVGHHTAAVELSNVTLRALDPATQS